MPDGRQTFPRAHRLTDSAVYERAFQSQVAKSTDRFFTVLATRGEHEHARLGLVVAKKKVGNAVRRNRVKRVIRESFRRREPLLPNLDLVVIARRGIAEHPNRELFSALARHWQCIQRQCEASC